MKVEVRNIRNGQDNIVGVIEWDGKNYILEPGNSRLLYNLMASPIRVGDKDYTSKDKEEFLKVLCAMTQSPYLRVSPIE